MITFTNATYNGFFFEMMKNVVGKGNCKKCGEVVDVKSFDELNDLINHHCKEINL